MNSGKKIEWEILENGCWNCTSHSTSYDGYPRLTRNQRVENMSRFIYKKEIGELLDSEVVRHKCDNPHCINPLHLEKGSYKDNMIDRTKRGRTATLERNGQSKLKIFQVLEIRRNPQITLWDFAKRLNVSYAAVRCARVGKTWKNI